MSFQRLSLFLLFLGLVGFALADSESKTAEYLRRAEQHQSRGEHRSALLACGRAYDYALVAKQVPMLALAAERFGLAQLRALEFQLAHRYLDQAKSLYGRLEDQVGVGRSLMNLGLVEFRLGRYELAKEYLDEAEPLLRGSPDLHLRWRVNELLLRFRDNRIELLAELQRLAEGDKELPPEYYLDLASLMVESGDTATASRILRSLPASLQLQPEYLLVLAQLQLRLGDPLGALALLRKSSGSEGQSQAFRDAFLLNRAMAHRIRGELGLARNLLEEALQRGDSARIRLQAATLAVAEKDPELALKHLARAEELLADRPEPVVAAWCKLARGEVQDDPQKLDEAARMGASLGLPELVWRSQFLKARLARARNDLQTAEKLYMQALNQAAEVRSEFSDEESLLAYQADKFPLYVEVVEMLFEQGRFEQAFLLAEAARGVRLKEMMRTSPLRRPTVDDIQTALGKEACLLSFLVGSDSMLAFVVTPQAVSAHRLPISERKLSQWLRGRSGMGGLVAVPGLSTDFPRELAQQVYQELLGPLEESIAAYPTWYLQLDGALHRLPLAVLMDSQGEPLFRKHTMMRLSHATPARASRPEGSAPLVMGAPMLGQEALPQPGALRDFRSRYQPLPGAAKETAQVAEILNRATLKRGSECRETIFRGNAAQAPVIHLATHGYVDDTYPLRSGLLMSLEPGEDGLLTAEEIKNVRLDSAVAVLSACETASGREFGGEGVVGLTYAFLGAGAEEVVASLWPIDDQSTITLMAHLHRELSQGKQAATALRQAAVASEKEKIGLYDIGAFVVYGRLHI